MQQPETVASHGGHYHEARRRWGWYDLPDDLEITAAAATTKLWNSGAATTKLWNSGWSNTDKQRRNKIEIKTWVRKGNEIKINITDADGRRTRMRTPDWPGEAVNRKAGQDGNQGRRYSADWEFQSLQGWSGWPASDGVKGGLPHGLQRRQEDDHTGRRRHKEIPAGSATEGLQPRRWLPRHLAQTGVADQDCPQSAGEANLPMGRAAQEFSLLLPPGLFGQSGASAVRR